jgi:cytochrome b subunit of formate dehydrogenase/mono/diheme cytochrome c family protein
MSSRTNSYERFPLWRRIEHLVMLLSFTTLAITGLPQKFPDASISISFVRALGGIENLRTVHHIAAIVMMLGTIWHLLVFGYLSYVRRVRLSMLPSLQDLKDGWQAVLYNLGFAKSFPQMGRYTFEEKMEYWAFVWGTLVMVITGFMMWNPIATARFLPGQVIPAAKAAHGGEAVLAVLAIIVWHMYGVHIKHLNKSMFTGKMSEAEMLHEHPLEMADIKAGIAERPVDPAALQRRQRLFLPIAAVIAIFLLGGVYQFVNAEQTALTTIQRQAPTVEIFVPQTITPAPTQTPTLEPTFTATLAPPTDTPIPSPTGVEATTEVTPTTSASTSSLTWDNTIGAMLLTKCSSCHGAGAMAGLNLSTYADALNGGGSGPAIVPGDEAASLLVTKQQAGGHPGQLTSEELALVIEWIQTGAPEK